MSAPIISNLIPPLFFAIPGDLNTPTGGYAYDRRLLAELASLGVTVAVLQLAPGLPFPDAAARAQADAAFASLPDGAVVLVDGLAFGALPEVAEQHAHRLRLIALCHHPLALETGLSEAQHDHFWQSERRALAAAQAVLVTSQTTANTLIQDFAVPTGKITLAEPGTDARAFAPCNGAPPVLLTLASLTRRKGHNYLIEALAKIAHLPWQARFVGSDQLDVSWAEALREQVRAMGLQERIAITGALPDVEQEFQQADVFVLPSLYEGYGMAFAEALAYGLPIVAARAGAVPQLVPADAGLLVPPGEVASLAEALALLLGDPAKRQQLQAGARAASTRLPSWQDTAARVAALINALAPPAAV